LGLTVAAARRHGAALAAVALVGLALLVGALPGEALPGATPVIVMACGLTLVPLLPPELVASR
jgi:hypothetical protein